LIQKEPPRFQKESRIEQHRYVPILGNYWKHE
jgi:hypothetical protein